jgi:hypothetical protein
MSFTMSEAVRAYLIAAKRSVETAVGTARGQEESGGAVEDLGWVHVERSRG